MAALKRKANWSEKEIVCLFSEVTENILLLSSKHDGNERSEKSKSVFWKELSERISSSGNEVRSCEEVMKKWKDIKSQTKKKEQVRRRDMLKTGGGGEVHALKDWEEKIITVIPKAVIEGVEGGVDVFQASEEGKASTSDTDNTVQTCLDETVLIHPENVHIQVECQSKSKESRQNMECVENKKRKKTLSELEAAQLDFYTANAALCKEQWKVAQQQVKTLSAQEEFYKHATKKLRDDDVSCLLNLFTEQ